MTQSEKVKKYGDEIRAKEDQLKLYREDIKDIYKRAKSDDVNTKALKNAIKEQNMDPAEREELKHTTEQYSLWL